MAGEQTVTAIYENGVLTPLEKVHLRKRQKVRVKISPLNGVKRKRKRSINSRRPSKSLTRDQESRKRVLESFGMWKDREDIGDAVEWVNNIRAGWEERLAELYKDV